MAGQTLHTHPVTTTPWQQNKTTSEAAPHCFDTENATSTYRTDRNTTRISFKSYKLRQTKQKMQGVHDPRCGVRITGI
jgi:hypothetical protein